MHINKYFWLLIILIIMHLYKNGRFVALIGRFVA